MTAPDGTVLPVTVASRSARLWRIEFAAPTAPGFFSLLIGPDITDPLGRKLDQDQDGQAGEAADDRYEAGFLLEAPASPAPPSGRAPTRQKGLRRCLSDKFIVTSYSPSGQQLLSQLKCSYFIVNFNHPVDESTLTPERIQTVRDVQFTGVKRLSPTQYRLEFQPTMDKDYQDDSRAQLNGPFVIGLAAEVRDTEGHALELGPPYIRFDAKDDLPPQITGAWVGLPETSGVAGAGFRPVDRGPRSLDAVQRGAGVARWGRRCPARSIGCTCG